MFNFTGSTLLPKKVLQYSRSLQRFISCLIVSVDAFQVHRIILGCLFLWLRELRLVILVNNAGSNLLILFDTAIHTQGKFRHISNDQGHGPTDLHRLEHGVLIRFQFRQGRMELWFDVPPEKSSSLFLKAVEKSSELCSCQLFSLL